MVNRRWLQIIARIGPVIGLVLVLALFTLINGKGFLRVQNLETMARQTAIVGAASLGMTIVIIAGGIDLSVGSVVAFTTVVIAALLQAGFSPLAAALLGIMAGGLCGLANGFLITRLRVVPFIVTLGTFSIVRGAAKGLANEQKIDAPITWLNDLLAALRPGDQWLMVPIGVWVVFALAVAVSAMLRFTRIGRYFFAIGSNEKASRLCGVPVDGVKITVYVIGGLFAGLAGLMQFSRLTVGDPTVAVGLELDVIAAVVIGGGSLAGGQGGIFGSILGALIMTVIRSGCAQAGVRNWVQEIATGTIIVIAVALDCWRTRRSTR